MTRGARQISSEAWYLIDTQLQLGGPRRRELRKPFQRFLALSSLTLPSHPYSCPSIIAFCSAQEALSLRSRISPTKPGFALPLLNFITWPLRKFSAAILPA